MNSQNSSLRATSQTAPASSFFAVTPSDVVDLPKGVTRAIFVGEAGIVAVRDSDGNTVEFISGASQYHPLRVARVMASTTTAGSIIALY